MRKRYSKDKQRKKCLSMEHRKHAYFDFKFKPDKGEGWKEGERERERKVETSFSPSLSPSLGIAM